MMLILIMMIRTGLCDDDDCDFDDTMTMLIMTGARGRADRARDGLDSNRPPAGSSGKPKPGKRRKGADP